MFLDDFISRVLNLGLIIGFKDKVDQDMKPIQW